MDARTIAQNIISWASCHFYGGRCLCDEEAESQCDFASFFDQAMKDFHADYSFEDFNKALPSIKQALDEDLDAAYNGDPAAKSKEEIVLSYPGFYAIMVHRVAHELYRAKVDILPRIMSEIAHSATGIDIHPGATIGRRFFIDHGTGIVIGETAEIGNDVRIYQGVTLGAKSLEHADRLRGVKRHPTVKDHVIIYSGASILGGDTVIGNNVTIGSNVYITFSVDDDKIVRFESKNYSIIDKRS
ncbi:MAG: hypothetical protein K6E59_06785 [Bacilli bacterium]|nr:hypothetical protein [Bacilli bacterium]